MTRKETVIEKIQSLIRENDRICRECAYTPHLNADDVRRKIDEMNRLLRGLIDLVSDL